MSDCIFCKIVAGEIPSKRVHEDAELIAFYDIRPSAPLHLLIIPKRHIATLADCAPADAELLGRMLLLAAALAEQHGCGYRMQADGAHQGGFKTQLHTGPNGGQEVYHLHLHVLGHPV